MSPTLNNDILLCIVEIVAEDYCQPEVPNPYEDPMGAWKAHYINQSYGRDLTAKGLLLALRRTCRFLATITMPFLFSHVTIDRIDKKNARRLNAICKSDLHCSAVKKYILKPEIVHTAPGKSFALHSLSWFVSINQAFDSTFVLSREVEPVEVLRRALPRLLRP